MRRLIAFGSSDVSCLHTYTYIHIYRAYIYIHIYTYIEPTCIYIYRVRVRLGSSDVSSNVTSNVSSEWWARQTRLISRAHEAVYIQPIPLGVTFSNAASKLKGQSSNVAFRWDVAKETFELWALSFRKCHPKWDWLHMSQTRLIDLLMRRLIHHTRGGRIRVRWMWPSQTGAGTQRPEDEAVSSDDGCGGGGLVLPFSFLYLAAIGGNSL